MHRPGLVAVVPSLCVALASACGDDDSSATPSTDAGLEAEASPVVPTATEARQTGRIIRAQTTDVFVEGATVAIAGKTAVTNAGGEYEIAVPRNVPYQMSVSAPDFFKLLDQEWIVKKDVLPRGDTQLLPTSLADFLAGLLPERDPNKGLLVVKINPMPPCASEEGATLALDPPGQAKLAYFSGSLPSSGRTNAKGGEAFTRPSTTSRPAWRSA